jgi:two-component system, response regulator, stage 0 sporulation protein F
MPNKMESTWRTAARLELHQRATRVLLAEDDDDLRDLVATALRRDGYDVITAHDGTELLDQLASVRLAAEQSAPIDLIISDVKMPGWTGLQVLEGIRATDWATPVILITGFGDHHIRREADRLGVAAFFDKPFDIDDLRTAVLNMLPVETNWGLH